MFLFISMGVNAYLFYRWSSETNKKRFLLYKIAHEENANPLFRNTDWIKKFTYIFHMKNGLPSWYINELNAIKKEL